MHGNGRREMDIAWQQTRNTCAQVFYVLCVQNKRYDAVPGRMKIAANKTKN